MIFGSSELFITLSHIVTSHDRLKVSSHQAKIVYITNDAICTEDPLNVYNIHLVFSNHKEVPKFGFKQSIILSCGESLKWSFAGQFDGGLIRLIPAPLNSEGNVAYQTLEYKI